MSSANVDQNSQQARPAYLKRTHRDDLLGWNELPEWRKDNEYILSGYRPESNSLRTSLSSVFAIHNETINIHSHLGGAVIFALLLIYFLHHLVEWCSGITVVDVAVFALYFAGVFMCFSLSSTYHILSNHSPRVAALGNQLDYLGVVMLMWGAAIPTIYYGFWGSPGFRKLYWTTTSILALTCAAMTMNPSFRTPAYRPYRTFMYASFGLSALVFICHGILINGLAAQQSRMSLVWMFRMACLNLIGAALYALRIPERWCPLRFDIFGASHQIFHFMVIFAGLAHTVGIVNACVHVHDVLES